MGKNSDKSEKGNRRKGRHEGMGVREIRGWEAGKDGVGKSRKKWEVISEGKGETEREKRRGEK